MRRTMRHRAPRSPLSRGGSSRSFPMKMFSKSLKALREAGATVPNAESVGRRGTKCRTVHRCRQQQHAGALDKLLREINYRIRTEVAWIRNASAIGPVPLKEMLELCKELLQQHDVVGQQLIVPGKNALAVLQCDSCKQFTGCRVADR